MSHATKADKLLIKPTGGAKRAPPCTRGRVIRKAHAKRPDARRVTSSTADTSLATAPDGPTQRLSQLLLCQGGARFECSEDDADEEAFEAADGFAPAFAFGAFAFEVGACAGMDACLGDRD